MINPPSGPCRENFCEKCRHRYVSRMRPGSNPEIWSSCPLCMQKIKDQERNSDHKRIKNDQRIARINAIGIPTRYGRCDISESIHASRARQWLNSNTGALWILGPLGVGKTWFACAICVQAASQGRDARYMTMSNYMQQIQNTWGSNSERESAINKPLTECSLLVIDDIGASRGHESEIWRLHILINDRYDRGLQTIVVSNLEPEELRKAIGDRAYDRLREQAVKIVITGTSRRTPALSS